MLSIFALLRRTAEPNPFLSLLLPLPDISSICGTSNIINLSGIQEVLPTPRSEEVFNWIIFLSSSFSQ